MVKYLGIDIGGTKCALVTADEDGKILKKVRFATTGFKETLQRIIDTAKELVAREKPLAVGVSCGGPLDARSGMILSPPNLPGWDEVPITRILSDELGIPAFLCNDANACALAEHEFGAGRGCDDMIFLTFGTGMGAGIISGGRLIEGACGNAGEAGHMRLTPGGPAGFGKNGSFEGWCSGGGIVKLAEFLAECLKKGEVPEYMLSAEESEKLAEKYGSGASDAAGQSNRSEADPSGASDAAGQSCRSEVDPSGASDAVGQSSRNVAEPIALPGWLSQQGLSTARICELAEDGDFFAQTVIRASARKLGQALSILIDLINPEKIVIGSVFARREEMFRKEMEAVIAREAIPASASVCSIVPAGLGESLGDYAAVAVAKVGLLSGR